jgi:sensor domain CHASE-containing protein
VRGLSNGIESQPPVSGVPAILTTTNRNASFDRARETGETYTTNPLLLVQGRIGSHIGVPVYSDGEFKAVVFATIDISALSEWYLADIIPEGHGMSTGTDGGRASRDQGQRYRNRNPARRTGPDL